MNIKSIMTSIYTTEKLQINYKLIKFNWKQDDN